MPTDADFMYSQLQVPFAINPYPIVTGPAYMNASQTLISESGDILLDGKIVNSNTTNIPQIATFNIGLANQLKSLTYNDPIWQQLTNLTSQDQLQACDCSGNPLSLSSQNKLAVISTLNYLKTQSNGDPSINLTNYLNSFTNYYIVAYSFIGLLIFHCLYKLIGRTNVVITYSIMLVIFIILFSYIGKYISST